MYRIVNVSDPAELGLKTFMMFLPKTNTALFIYPCPRSDLVPKSEYTKLNMFTTGVNLAMCIYGYC